MGNINLSFPTKVKKQKTNKVVKKKEEKIILTYHPSIPAQKEYYTYVDKDGNEIEFNDSSYVISKLSATKYVGKKVNILKTNLEFVPSKESVDYQPGYFTYNGTIYDGPKPIFDVETNSYIGTIDLVKTYEKEIKLYEEI